MITKNTQFPKISIIIPVYNAEKHIRKTLDNLSSQPLFSLCEVIIIDDGSTDHSHSILESFCKKNKNAVLYSQENKGVSAARNLGILKSNGKYIMFLDSDDYYVNGFIDYPLYSDLIQHPEYDIWIYSMYYSNNNRNRYQAHSCILSGVYEGHRYLDITVHFASLIYKKDVLYENHIYFDNDISMNEDQVFVQKAVYCARKVFYSSHYLYIYNHVTSGSLRSYNRFSDSIKSWNLAYQWFKANADEHSKDEMLNFCLKMKHLRQFQYYISCIYNGDSYKKLETKLNHSIYFVGFNDIPSSELFAPTEIALQELQDDHHKYYYKTLVKSVQSSLKQILKKLPIVNNIYEHRFYPLEKAKY